MIQGIKRNKIIFKNNRPHNQVGNFNMINSSNLMLGKPWNNSLTRTQINATGRKIITKSLATEI
jgi:hypothetical protein